MKRRVLFFTGTRADWGLLLPLARRFQVDPQYDVQVLATGSHYAREATFGEIIQDGFQINYAVDLKLQENSAPAAMGVGLARFDEVLQQAKPDLAFVLGDRYEGLAFAVTCQFNKIPLAHLHGGEITEGAVDEAFRHSITKMALFHFAASEGYAKRIIKLGEEPKRVFNVGALGVENALNTKLKSREELGTELNITIAESVILVTFHPATLEVADPGQQMQTLCNALKEILKLGSDLQIILTMPNADPGSDSVRKVLTEFISQNSGRVFAFNSLGRVNYLSLLNISQVVVGNSSSGIIEAPVFAVPTLNLGSRQTGRERSASVVDVEVEEAAIVENLKQILKQKKLGQYKNTKSLFGSGKTSSEIKSIIDKTPLSFDLRKRFYE